MIPAILGLVGAGFQIYNAQKQKKQAQSELNDYERQDLDNAFKNIKISTLGSDILKEENQRTSSDMVEAARMGGARGVIGSIPKIVEQTNLVNKDAAKLLDDQVRQREYAIANDETRIQGIKEGRDQSNISALSSQIDSANQDFWSGINSAITSTSYLTQGIKSKQNKNSIEPNNNLTINDNKTALDNVNITPNTPYSNLSNDYSSLNIEENDLINKYGKKNKYPMF